MRRFPPVCSQWPEHALEWFRTLEFVGPAFSVSVPSDNMANEGLSFKKKICFCLVASIETVYLGPLVPYQTDFFS